MKMFTIYGYNEAKNFAAEMMIFASDLPEACKVAAKEWPGCVTNAMGTRDTLPTAFVETYRRATR